ncbi:hypothetical protein R3P38DRAFT_2880006 [Favolaschia claudopus]|uniref:F-box domain-containing protein n=1 Tax=Favolaschia claudopus TaxID=2862362 RepID=A0AAW0D1P0_9AGAR
MVPPGSGKSPDKSQHRRPHKRSKTSNSTADSSSLVPTSAHIFKLPFELIAEILVYTACPKDVLAVARCNKYMCKTLLRQESAFIWRSARQNCLPAALPDPEPLRMSESAFAAFIYDGGECITCGVPTKNMYASFCLNVRFCNRPDCRDTFGRVHTRTVTNFDILTRHLRKALAWIPLAEAPACFFREQSPLHTWPDAPKLYLASTMDAALVEYGRDNSKVVDQRHAADINNAPARMSFFVALYNWRHQRELLFKQVKTDNETFGKQLALKEGYDYTALLNGSPTYQQLYAHRTRNLELLARLDYDVVSDKIEAEMISAQERQTRRTNEATLKANRLQVEQHYQRLVTASRSKVPMDPLPSLEEFRTMPVLNLIKVPAIPAAAPKGKGAAKGSVVDLKNNDVVAQLLQSELTGWRKEAETALGKTLGVTQWKTARNNKLHPARRLTARWNCKCGKVSWPYKWDESLDFQGVCKHECTKSKKSRARWDADQFVKDDKAINAMTKVVKLCGIDVEDPGSFKALDDIGPRIQCLSCPAAIVMCPSSVPGHCHRHEEMEMFLLSQSAANALVVAPIEQGRARDLMGHQDVKTKIAEKTWTFGCRHCEQRIPPPVVEKKVSPPEADAQPAVVNNQAGVEATNEGSSAPKGTSEPASKNNNNMKKKPKRFEFNGLRSHLQEKHSIPLLNDEDFFVAEKLPAK